MSTTEAAYAAQPGTTHALAVIAHNRGMHPRAALVLLTAGVLMERDLRSPNGYGGHSLHGDLAHVLNIHVDDLVDDVASLVADGHLVLVPEASGGYSPERWRQALSDPERGSRWGDVYANLAAGYDVVVRIPETIEVTR